LGLPPLLFVLVVLGSSTLRHRERRSTTASSIQRRLLRSAEDALRHGSPRSFYDRVVDSIHHALESRLGEPVAGLPQTELRARLTEAGLDDDLVQRVINELEGADFARFAASGVSKDEMERCLDRAEAIIVRIRSARSST
jgi:cytosine/adenosine deaminase-related metal-dependent hydrolase